MKSQIVDEAFRRILALKRGVAPGSCPDANEFAAYLERGLSSAEAARFEEHASNCQSCQEALALSLALMEDEAGTARRPVAEPRRFAYRSSPLRFALASVVLLTVGVLLFQATREYRMIQPESRIARQEAKKDTPSPEPVTPRAGAFQPAKVAPAATRESAGSSLISGDKKELPASQPSLRAPAGAAAPAPAIAADTAVAARASQAAAATEQKAAAPRPAVGEAMAEAPKGVQAQRVDLVEKSKQAFAQADETRLQVAVADRQRAAGQARAGTVQQIAAQAPAEAVAAQAARPALDNRVRLALQEASAAKEQGQKFGDRVLLRTADCWVEVECTRHEGVPAREMMRDSREFSDLLAKEPGLAELPKDMPVLIFWNGTNLLIR